MFVRQVTVRGHGKTYRYAQLVKSFRRRKDGRSTHRVLANLGALPDAQVQVLRCAFASLGDSAAPVLPASTPVPGAVVAIQQNLGYLDLAVALEAWHRSNVGELLTELVPTGGSEMPFAQVIAALTLHRCLAPDSKKAAERWFPQTALPELLGVAPGRLRNTRIHRALGALDEVTEQLQARLPALLLTRKPRFAALFLDVTDTWFVGRGPPLAEKAFTKEGFYEHALGIVLLCDEDGFPVRWQVVSARSHDSRLMMRLLESVRELEWIREIPVALDRAMGTTAVLRDLVATGLRFVTALTVTEFDAYTHGRMPSEAVAEIVHGAPRAAARAAGAVEKAGMHRLSDTCYVLDLGVVERTPSDDGPRRPLDEANPLGDALALAEQARTLVSEGRARDYSAAARTLGTSKAQLSKYMSLLQLAPDLQDEVRAGRGRMALARLLPLAQLPQPEAQRRQYAVENQRPRTMRRPPRTARTDAPPVPPVRLRAVVSFNPERFVTERKNADETLGKIRAFERDLNVRLLAANVHRARDSVYTDIVQELRHRELLDAFDILIEERNGYAKHVELRLRAPVWQSRRRFDGFAVIVAHPASLQSADALVALYRDKDCVEKDFRHIKSEIELRPLWHHTDAKVRAHVTLCMLALLVDRLLERTLREAGRPLTAQALYEELNPVHLNRCRLANTEQSLYLLTETSPDQQALLTALSMQDLRDAMRIAERITPR